MARPRKQLDTHGHSDKVIEAFKAEQPGWKKDRLRVIKLGLENKLNISQIAELTGVGNTTVVNWFTLFREGGIQKLLTKDKGSGPELALSEEMMQGLKQGLEENLWRTGPQAYKWLTENFDVNIHPNNIYKYLKKLGGRLKVPRPSHKKKDLQAVEKFKQNLTQELIDLRLDPRKPLRLSIYDEMRYGLAPITRRMWGLRGKEIIAPVCKKYEWGYLFGALQVGGGGSEFLFSPTVSKFADLEFMGQISRRDPYANHVVIGDGAGFHHKQNQDNTEVLPDHIHILTLPPYSPELNPVEQLWDSFKNGICNKCYDTLEEVERDITTEIKKLWNEPKKVLSLIGNGYLLGRLNATCKYLITPN